MNSGPLVPVDPVILQTEAWEAVLMSLFIGFLLGLMTNIKTGGGNRYFTVAIAQIPYQFQEFRVPLLPRCVFVASLLALLPMWENADFFVFAHLLFVICVIALFLSVGAWLYAASRDLARDEKRRKREIEDFLADPKATIPVPGRSPGELPAPFHVWSKINNLLFLLLTLRAAAPVLVFVWRNHHIATA
jgi:hypothetical protein